MLDSIIAVLICAALFVLYGWVKQKGCDGHCAGCLGNSCERLQHHD